MLIIFHRAKDFDTAVCFTYKKIAYNHFNAFIHFIHVIYLLGYDHCPVPLFLLNWWFLTHNMVSTQNRTISNH